MDNRSGEKKGKRVLKHHGRENSGLFEELIRPFYPRIYRWAFVLTGNPDDADDVTQEVVIRAYRHFGSFRREASLSTWLYRITRNVAVEMMRRRAWRNKQKASAMVDKLATDMTGFQAVDESDGGQILDIIKLFMNELSRRQRQVFDLVDLQGYEPVEAGEMLGINAATARTHLLRARRLLRSRILGQHPELVEGIG